jgi:hypothetical protein
MRVLTAALRATIALTAILASPALSQSAPPDSGFRFRVGGDIEVAATEREGGVVVIRGNARVSGRVGALIVVGGTATIDSGRVVELIVVRGEALLTNGAVVAGDAHLIDSKIDVASGSRVEGRIERGVGRRYAREVFAFIALVSLGVLAAVVIAGVLAALVAPTQLVATGALIRAETGRVAGYAALIWLAFPVLAVLLIPTIVGLPFGLGYLLFVMPLIGFVGLIVAGTWLGGLLLRRTRSAGAAVNPVASAAVGVALLLLVGRIPILGLVTTILVMLGAGAAGLAVSRAAFSPRGTAPAPAHTAA